MIKSLSQVRSHNYIRQVKGSFLLKGLAIACTFFSTPLIIHYLGKEQFGIWATLLSIITWITFFDLGLGNGLRNKLTESLANRQTDEAQVYISSAYSLVGIISLALFLILAVASFIVPWQKVFNTQVLTTEELSCAVLITSFFITLNFWIGLINSILNAVQKSSIVVFGQFLFNVFSLFFVYLLTNLTNASLLYIAIIYGISMVSSNAFLSGWFYKDHLNLIPKLSLRLSHVQPMLNLGLQFFLIQIAVLVIFTTDKLLISQLFGPSLVTTYEVVFKFFGIITLIYGLISAPLWSAYTDAYHHEEYVWIKRMLIKQLVIFGITILIVVLFILIAKSAIVIWIGEDLFIPMPLTISMGLFVVISIWNNIYAFFLNGIGRIRIQLYSALLAMLINIPLALYFTKSLGLGVEGIVLATCTSLSVFAILGPFEVYTLLRSKR